ncbi:TIR domain-containing protein [Streptomyces sp. S6]
MTERPPFFFTSYAVRPADKPLVESFHRRLQQETEIKRGRSAPHGGFLDAGSITLGENWHRKIATALGRTRFLVALLTDDYLTSPWCAREWAVMRERVRLAAPEEPVAILPLFWTRLSRELPTEVADLQLRTASLGALYTDTCLVDLVRGDATGYERFVIGLTDHMVKAASVELPEMEAESAATYPPAFGLGAPEGETGAVWVTKASTGVKPAFGAKSGTGTPSASKESTTSASAEAATALADPIHLFEKRTLIEALLLSPISGPRETYDLWLESVRLLVAPTQLAPSTDAGALRIRVTALVNFALRQKTPTVLLAYAEALEELGADEATTEVRRLVDLAEANWP